MRLFIAINMPEEIKKKIQRDIKFFKKKLSGVKWVKSHKLHLTLKFLGDVKKDINKIKKSLDAIDKNSFKINFKDKYEAFYRRNIAKVIHLPIKKENSLVNLKECISNNMQKLGFEREKKDFYPHITIGRVKKTKIKKIELENLFEEKKVNFNSFKVERCELIKSALTHKGPIYNSIKTIYLK